MSGMTEELAFRAILADALKNEKTLRALVQRLGIDPEPAETLLDRVQARFGEGSRIFYDSGTPLRPANLTLTLQQDWPTVLHGNAAENAAGNAAEQP